MQVSTNLKRFKLYKVIDHNERNTEVTRKSLRCLELINFLKLTGQRNYTKIRKYFVQNNDRSKCV